MSDNVEHPSHYNAGGVETIEGIKAALGDGFSDYCLGNVIKYVWRCKHKGKLLEDLRKAAKYLEWAIEAAESNSPESLDSSSGKAIPIPSGWRELEPDEMPKTGDNVDIDGQWVDLLSDWNVEYRYYSTRMIRKIEPSNPNEPQPLPIPHEWRELEPDEMPLATDMHEWMGKWIVRTTDSGQPYKWHDHRNIRKIETPKPEPLAIPEGWRELEADEMPRVTDLYENEGAWRNRINDSSIEYARYEVRHIRKIETANPSKAPNSSIPDPGPGYRLLSKHPPEQVISGDEFWQNFNREWVESENFIHEGGPQAPELYYRRKIEPTEWIPKVGDRVRVNSPGRIAHGKTGLIIDVPNSEYAVRIEHEKLTTFNLKAEHLELIEAAS